MTATASKLSKLDIKALKNAERVVFHYRNGSSYILAIDKDDKDRRIDCGTRISNYRKELGNVRAADYCNLHVKYDHAYRTMVESLKEGDELTLHWVANNNNQYLDRAGLFHDQLKLIVERETGRGKKRLEFIVGDGICENNTAKMIRHTSTPMSVFGV